MITFHQRNRPPEDLIEKRLSMADDDFINNHHAQWHKQNWFSDMRFNNQPIGTLWHTRAAKHCLLAQLEAIKHFGGNNDSNA